MAKYGYELSPAVQGQMARFKALWKYYQSTDYPTLMREHNGRQALIDRVKDDLKRALRKPDDRAPGRFRFEVREVRSWEELVPDEEVLKWIERDRFVYEGLTKATQRALAFISRFEPKGR